MTDVALYVTPSTLTDRKAPVELLERVISHLTSAAASAPVDGVKIQVTAGNAHEQSLASAWRMVDGSIQTNGRRGHIERAVSDWAYDEVSKCLRKIGLAALETKSESSEVLDWAEETAWLWK